MSVERTVQHFIISEYLSGTDPSELGPEYDLLATGVIDSLGLLKLVSWLEDTFALQIDDLDISPDHFRSVATITDFVSTAGHGSGEAVSE